MSEKNTGDSRKWLLTINNPIEHDMGHDQIRAILEKIKGKVYWCMCDEIGLETKTYHTHIFLYRPSPFTFDTIKGWFPTAHIDKALGTPEQNRDYIRKEGKYADSDKKETNLPDTFEESGDCPHEKQGERTDLTNLYQFIKDGMSDFEIIEADPKYIKRLQDIDRVRQVIRNEEFKNKPRDVQVEYWYGKTGTGKTSGILKLWGYENVYRITDYLHPWDDYSGQSVVVFEEFHSQFQIGTMLNWLDIHPLKLPCRYANKVACYEHVYLTSNAPLSSQYRNVQFENPETWFAFLRRIKGQKYFDGQTVREYHNVAGSVSKSGFIEISGEPGELIPFAE